MLSLSLSLSFGAKKLMGRRKSKPNRSVGILEGEVPKGQINGKIVSGTAEKDESVAVEVPYFVEIDRSYWLSDEHMEFLKLVSNVNEYLTRIKLGHWPVLSTSNICLEIVAKQEMEGLEETVALVVGSFDGPDEVISGLVHLASLKFFTLRPVIMGHIVPEVVTSEARYGYQVAAHADIDLPSGLDEISSAARKLSRFDVASFYEAINPSKDEPMFDDDLPDLLPKLRPYQRRAAYWMVQREKRNSDGSLQSKINHFISPLSMLPLDSLYFYHPLNGNVSLRPESAPSVVPGGILAGKTIKNVLDTMRWVWETVELLACIFKHQVASSSIGNFTGEFLCDEGQKNSLKRLKRERVECICGCVSESIRHKGLWVQCDVFDWEYAQASKKNDVKVVEMEGGYICQPCSELIQATVSPVASGATLIVCPAPILPQWHAEIVRYALVSKAPSDLEVVLGLIKSNSRGLFDAEGVLGARKQLQLLEGMRKEYAQARLLATAQAHVLRAHDEITMATSRLHLKEDENDKSIDALDPEELDAASAEWSSEKFFFLSSLSRMKGQLRYLKGLVQSKQTNDLASSENSTITQDTIVSVAHAEEKKEYQANIEEDTCPVCQEKLNNQKMVFQCGHVICCKCLFAMTEKRLALHGKPQVNWLMCPTCRQHTDCRNIAYAVDRQNKSYPSSSIVSGNNEASTNVQGERLVAYGERRGEVVLPSMFQLEEQKKTKGLEHGTACINVKDTVEESICKLNKSRNIGSFVSGNRKNQDQPVLTLRDIESLFRAASLSDEKATGSLMQFPPSVAAAIAAERRLREQTSCQEPQQENC
ncbi:hypothetical protein RND71_030536 [Anisodus tanguticus]|uniref:RING-type domain-containing protein n=1 Tax=Anisodus tanguticus TaxID=243964 RepID=A0AAE1RGL0_9SOLA|nr:hypothetical protein RND71_030536 [Anisodus tanguticus]